MNTTLSSNNIFSNSGGGASSGIVGTVVIGIVNSEVELNTLYPATDPKYKDGTFAIVDSITERKLFFVKNQTWLWSEEFTQVQIDNLITLVNDLKTGIKKLGTFDPKTNTPALPLTPLNANYDAGDYYEIIGLNVGEEFTWNGLVLTNKDWVIVEKDGSDTVLKWEKRNYGVFAKDIFYDNTTSGATATNLQDVTDELFNEKQNNILKANNQAEMLALSNAIVGDIVTRADDNGYLYRLNALPASNLSNWEALGKDTQPVGETVEDIITNNEIITSKVDGLYAFADVPNGGFPAGVARGDIAEKTGSSWVVVYTFATAPASIFAKSDGKVYNKKIDNNNNPTWFVLPEPTFYEVGSGKEYATLQSAVDAYDISGKPLGVINVFDQIIAENVTINANIQNLLIQGFGALGRANTQISKITILGHRVTLNTLQVNEVEINSTGTITENGVPNTGRGKHIFEKVSFSNPTTAITVTAINNFLAFYSCDFFSKTISIANHIGVPTSITFNNCQNGILNLGSNRLCIKAYSPSVYRGTVTGTIIDLDSATPIAYSLLREYTALGLPVPISIGTMVINDDVGGNLANLKCTTAYTIAPALGVGTPIDLTKYQVQTDNSKADDSDPRLGTKDIDESSIADGRALVYNGGTGNLEYRELGGGGGLPVGFCGFSLTNVIPAGCLELNGQTFNQTLYPDLFAYLGTNVLRDLRGLFLRGAGVTTANGLNNGVNYNATTVGAFQDDLFKSHLHGSGVGSPNRTYPLVPMINVGFYMDGTSSGGGNYLFTTQATGGIETRPKNIGAIFYIQAE